MRSVLFYALGLPALFAQPAILVQNAASGDPSQIAPGSLIRVGLQPAAITGAPMPIDPASVTIQIQPEGSVQVLGSSGPFGVLALLSGDTPPGPAALTMNRNGQASAPAAIRIAPSGFGLFTRSQGTGPVLGGPPLSHAARPGDFVTLWGTGLGQAARDRVTVLLGGHPVSVSYAGPAPGFPGTDPINFQVPEDPAIPRGCYVALAVQVDGAASNTGMLSTSSDGGPCRGPFGFTASQLAQLDAGESLYLGQVSLYGMVGPPSPSPWFAGTGFTRMESADALFPRLDAVNAALLTEPLVADDALDACHQAGSLSVRFLGSSGAMSVGPKITLSSGAKSLDLPLENPDFPSLYRAQLPAPEAADSPDAVPPAFFSPGVWQVTARAFSGQLTLPPTLRIAGIDQSAGLTVTWNGADYQDYIAVLYLIGTPAVVCRTAASAGRLTIPAALLSGPRNASLELLLSPRPDRIPVTLAGSVPVLLRYYSAVVLPVALP